MNKQLSLIYNECVKQFKKMGNRMIIVIIVVLGVVVPMSVNEFQESGYDALSYELQFVNDEIAYNETLNEPEAQLRNEFLQEKLAFISQIEDNISFDSYQWDLYHDALVLMEELTILSQREGYSIEQFSNALYYPQTTITSILEQYEGVEEIRLEQLENEISSYLNLIITDDYALYLEKDEENVNAFYENLVQELARIEKELEDSTLSEHENHELTRRLEELTLSIEKQEILLDIYAYAQANPNLLLANTFSRETIEDMLEETKYTDFHVMDEEAFEQSQGSYSGYDYTYEQYYHDKTAEIKQYEHNMAKHWYSLEQNIPQLNYVIDARTVVNQYFEMFTILGVLVSILIGGAIVSQEFATGSIRLLLIRPVKRSKILSAKFFTSVITGVLITLLGQCTLVIVAGLKFGFETFNVPILEVVNGEVLEIAFFSFFMANLGAGLVSLIFMAVFATMLSTLLRNTAIAVALSNIMYLGSFAILLILASYGVKGLEMTILPYINHSILGLSPHLVLMIEQQLKASLNPTLGVILLLSSAVVMWVISFVHFNRADINN